MPGMGRPVVELTDGEYAWAVNVGEQRYAIDLGTKDKPQYANQSKKKYTDLAGSVVPCLAEIAVAKYLDQYWPGAVWHVHDIARMEALHADVGLDIEVRHAVFPNAGLPVRPKDIDADAQLVLVHALDPDEPDPATGLISTYAGYKTWEMIGTMDAATAWGKDRKSPADALYKRCPQSGLDPVDSLHRPSETAGLLTDDQIADVRNSLEYWEKPWVRQAVYRAAMTPGETRNALTIEKETLARIGWAKTRNRFWVP